MSPLPATQEIISEEQPPASATSSENSLGKRKASELSSTSSISPFRPPKASKCIHTSSGEDNVFETKPCTDEIPDESGNIYAPISIVSPSLSIDISRNLN